MKKIIFLLAILLATSVQLFAQSPSPRDVFNAPIITWLGLDFSEARFIGSQGFEFPPDIKARYMDEWNMAVIKDPRRFDLKRAFHKRDFSYDIDIIAKRNQAKVDPSQVVINKSYSFGEDEVQKIVSQYDLGSKSGVGIVFVVESYDKINEAATVYVTLIDMASKKVLFTERMRGKAARGNMVGHWAATTDDILNQITSRQYKIWQTRYYN